MSTKHAHNHTHYLKLGLLLAINSVVVTLLVLGAFYWVSRESNVMPSEAAVNRPYKDVISGKFGLAVDASHTEVNCRNYTGLPADTPPCVFETTAHLSSNFYYDFKDINVTSTLRLAPPGVATNGTVKFQIVGTNDWVDSLNFAGPVPPKTKLADFKIRVETKPTINTDPRPDRIPMWRADIKIDGDPVPTRDINGNLITCPNIHPMCRGRDGSSIGVMINVADNPVPIATFVPTSSPTPGIVYNPNFVMTARKVNIYPVYSTNGGQGYYESGVSANFAIDKYVSNVQLAVEVAGQRTYHSVRCNPVSQVIYVPGDQRCDQMNTRIPIPLTGPGMTSFYAVGNYNGRPVEVILKQINMLARPGAACGYYRPGYPIPCPAGATATPTPSYKSVNGVNVDQKVAQVYVDPTSNLYLLVRLNYDVTNTTGETKTNVSLVSNLSDGVSRWYPSFTGAYISDYGMSGGLTKNPSYNGFTESRLNASTTEVLAPAGSPDGRDKANGFIIVRVRKSTEADYTITNDVTLSVNGTAITHKLTFQVGNGQSSAPQPTVPPPTATATPTPTATATPTPTKPVTAQTGSSSSDEYCPTNSSALCRAPVLEWKFDENAGATAYDSSGTGLTGMLHNNPIWSLGKIGSSLNFDKVDDAVSTPANSAINDLTQYTFSAWIFPRSMGEGDYGRIIQKDSAGSGVNAFLLHTNTPNSLQLVRGRSGGQMECLSAANAITTNRWQHVVGVVDIVNNYCKLYINGIEPSSYVTKVSGSGSLSSDASYSLQVGNRHPTQTDRTFDGYIDQVRVYNYVRTPAQISWEYSMGAQ